MPRAASGAASHRQRISPSFPGDQAGGLADLGQAAPDFRLLCVEGEGQLQAFRDALGTLHEQASELCIEQLVRRLRKQAQPALEMARLNAGQLEMGRDRLA